MEDVTCTSNIEFPNIKKEENLNSVKVEEGTMLNKLVSEDKPNLSKRENTKLPKRLP